MRLASFSGLLFRVSSGSRASAKASLRFGVMSERPFWF